MVLFLITVILELFLAWKGVDFSPSFAAYFVFFFILFDGISAILNMGKKPGSGWKKVLSGILLILGNLAVTIGSYTYAAGDDPITRNLRLSLVIALIGYLVLCFTAKEKGLKTWFGNIPFLFYFVCGFFNLLSAITCPALLPLGIGVLLLAGMQLMKERIPLWFYYCGLAAGYLLADAFLVAPMVF